MTLSPVSRSGNADLLGEITIEVARGWTMREHAHYNGGREWFGYGHQCIENPRLYRLDRYMRKDRSVQSEWSVDGEKCASFEDAVERLKLPPAILFDEMEMLALIEPEFIGWNELKAKPGYGAFAEPHHQLHYLDRKGLIEWQAGKVRLTASGASALATFNAPLTNLIEASEK